MKGREGRNGVRKIRRKEEIKGRNTYRNRKGGEE